MWFNPQVIPDPITGKMYSVRKFTLTGWKYLDLWNYKHWFRRKNAMFFNRCVGGYSRAFIALSYNANPAPF